MGLCFPTPKAIPGTCLLPDPSIPVKFSSRDLGSGRRQRLVCVMVSKDHTVEMLLREFNCFSMSTPSSNLRAVSAKRLEDTIMVHDMQTEKYQTLT